jgi:hypothetical protein
MAERLDIDQLEADLGLRSALRVLANCGGQRRSIPLPKNAARSALAREIGADAAHWIAARYGGEDVDVPSRSARENDDRAAHLVADILEAGLTDPRKSANDLAAKHGVTTRHVHRLRAELRASTATGGARDLPLFSRLNDTP